ncbi:MAG TPA: hypothetical protein VEC94_01910 [Pseudolabrys sp.]|nr:hypothetical protein [Pseudolabrys sp.]
MQAMQILASGGVTMAAGAMISLSFAVSPPLTLVPPRPAAVATAGVVIADTFERRWQAATDRVPEIGQEAQVEPDDLRVAAQFERQDSAVPPRDPLAGLIGGLPMLPAPGDVPQVAQGEPHGIAPQPQQQASASVALQDPSVQPSDVCARHGLRRVDYTQNHHRYWRCADQR